MRSSLVVTDSTVWTAETEYALAVAEAEAASGFDVTVAAPVGSPAAPGPASPLSSLELPGREPSKSVADFVSDARYLAYLVRRERYDVVHSSRPTAHILAALATGTTIPLVHLRGSASPPSGHAANRFLYGRATDAVIVSSSRVESWVRSRLRVPDERVARLLLPVDPRWFEPPTEPLSWPEPGVPEGAPVVLCVARLAPVKGHGVLLEAMSAVLASVPEAVLVLVGEPWSGQPEGLASRARELGVERSVRFAGRRDDVRTLVDAASVCVVSSIGSEENSRAVAEYMAAARPVVATSVGVIPELVADGETGLIVPPGAPAPMAEGIVALLTDRSLAARTGKAGRISALKRFSHSAFAEGLSEILARVERHR